MPTKSIALFYIFIFTLMSIDESSANGISEKKVSQYFIMDDIGVNATENFFYGVMVGMLIEKCDFGKLQTRQIAEQVYFDIKYSSPDKPLVLSAGKSIYKKYNCKKREKAPK